MQIRFLQYLVALAEQRHFARAAAVCHVSQPTLSAGIAALEDLLGGVRLVDRDRRFVGLTAEGEAALPWARAILADHLALRTAVDLSEGPLVGELRLGIIPAAMPVSGRLVRTLVDTYPGLTVSLHAMTSREIEAGLVAQDIHAGLTYLSHEPLPQVRRVELVSERYLFATRTDAKLGGRQAVRWEEVADEPLCLLHQGMQNRRILDEHLAGLGLQLKPTAITDSYVTLIAMVEAGGLSTIISDSYAPLMAGAPDVRVMPFAPPAPPNVIGLVVLDRPAIPRLSAAALACAEMIAEGAAGSRDDRSCLSSIRQSNLTPITRQGTPHLP